MKRNIYTTILCLGIVLAAFICAEYANANGDLATNLCFIEQNGRLYPYRIFFPSSYKHAPEESGEPIEKFPLVIALHSANEDETAYFQWRHNADRIQTIAEERGYVIACPAAPDQNWHVKSGSDIGAKEGVTYIISKTMDEIIRQRHIDVTKIYLMGASSGGIATYAAVADSPHTFAAVGGICAAFPEKHISRLKYTPILMLCAQKDKQNSIETMHRLRDDLDEAGGVVKMVEMSGGHGVYRSIETYQILFDWFDTHQRSAEDTPSSSRWEQAMQNYERKAKEHPPDTGGVVFIGSSSIGMWKTLKSDFAPINVIGRGFGGSHVIDSFLYAHRVVIPYKPQAVVIYAGDNDIASGKTPDRVLADFEKFVNKVHADLPDTRIHFICIKPSISRWRLWDKMNEANIMVRDFAEGNDMVEYIDIASPMLGEDGKPLPELFIKDGLHLNADGYKLWTSIVKPYIEL